MAIVMPLLWMSASMTSRLNRWKNEIRACTAKQAKVLHMPKIVQAGMKNWTRSSGPIPACQIHCATTAEIERWL